MLFSSAMMALLSAASLGAPQEAAPEASPLAEPVSIVEASAEALVEPAPAFFNDAVSDPIPTVCPFKGEFDYEPGEVACGYIDVPENRSDPESRTIRLLYAKIAAKASLESDEDEAKDDDEEELVYRDDPIAYLTGGPGVGIRSYVPRFMEHDLAKTRDLYVLQQRGIDESSDFCPAYGSIRPEAVAAKTSLESTLAGAERMKNCLLDARARGVDITAYNTVENAHDVRALRRALGFESWNVWGISYGSHLGQMLVNVDPEGIKALVIDAIVPNDLGDLGRIGRWITRDLNLIWERCEETGNRHCRDLEARVKAAAKQPLVRIEALDEEVTPAGEVYLPPALPVLLAFTMMYEQDEHPAIPAVLDGGLKLFEEGHTDLLAIATADDDGGVSVSQGMSSALRCSDGYTQKSADVAAEDIAENSALLGDFFSVEGAEAMVKACEEAGVPMIADRSMYQLVETDIPTLIINGAWDPITPPPLAERITAGFSNSRYVEVPYAGHGPTRSMSECSGQVLTDFFDAPDQDLSGLDMTCFEEGVPAPEFKDYFLTTGHLKLANLAVAEEYKKLALPGAVTLFSTLSLLGGMLMIPFGFFGRLASGGRARELATGDSLTRVLALVTSVATVGGLGLIGVGAAKAFDIAAASLLVGFTGIAGTGSWLVLLSGVLGAVLVVRTVLARLGGPLRTGTLLGFLAIGLSSASLAMIAAAFDFGPF